MCRQRDLEIRWTLYPLHPETPPEGRLLTDLFAGKMDVAKAMADLGQLAAGIGLPFGDRTHTYNSRHAQEVGKWAEQEGRGEDFRKAVFHAYFAAGRNIFDPKVLGDICSQIGLPGENVTLLLEQGLFAAAVDADWQRTARYAITSIPSRLYKQQVLVGYQPAEKLVELIDSLSQTT